MEKNFEVKRAQLGVVPGWVTFLGSLPLARLLGQFAGWVVIQKHCPLQPVSPPPVEEPPLKIYFRFFPGSPFVASGGGSSQECSVFVSGHRCVAPVIRSVPFGWAAFWWRFSPRLLRVVSVVIALSLYGDELSLLPVGLSLL
ncbi:hypothetical protein Taro_031720 [Colocasia esculenta]|uniref:Uncharacterized protein n=1 Tax=Colocasia esculenta TaxID=4460 RepID=A0A843VZT4_COLES|nr:hypothetical protein [Colocasia esculenta]